MALRGAFDPELTWLAWFDRSEVASGWWDAMSSQMSPTINASRSMLGLFTGEMSPAGWFDSSDLPSRWFDPTVGPDEYPTLSSIPLSWFFAAPFFGSPWDCFVSSEKSGTRYLTDSTLAPAVGDLLNGRSAANFTLFSPLSIAGCAIWYDLAHNTNTGTTVTALPDQSGNGRDAVIVGGHEPGYTASAPAYNNLPIMSFATVEWATTPATGITNGARTFVLVCDIGTAASCFAVCDDAFGIWVQGNGTDIGAAGDNANIIHGGALSIPSVVVFIDNGASSQFYINALTPVATGLDGGPQDLTGRVFTLGNCGFNLIAANSQVGSTAQFLIYNSALSPTDVATLLNGFGTQYGIAIGP